MYNSFQVISNFVKEVYGFDLLKRPERIKIEELENAYHTIMSVIDNRRKPFSREFVEYVYPLLEVSVQWAELKDQGKLTAKFLRNCKKRMRPQDQSNYYGTIFEIDMASRCLLSGWDIEFVEDYAKAGRPIDFVFCKENGQGMVGVECTSKRYTEDLTPEKIEEVVKDKAKKFEKKNIEKLGISLDEKVVVVDITRKDYSTPPFLDELGETLDNLCNMLSSKLDAVVLTWREDVIEGESHSLIAKYETFGNIDKRYFSTTYAGEIHVTNVMAFFFRKYVEPEPTWGTWGSEESAEEYHRKAA